MHFSLPLRWAVIYTLVMFGLIFSLPLLAFPAVVINEVLADPASDWDGDGEVNFRNDEWVEVFNNGPETVDLAGYFLRDSTGEAMHLGLEGHLEPDQTRVFYGQDAVLWQQANGQTVTGLSLNNGGDTVELLQWDGMDYTVRDSVIYLDHEAEDDRSSGWNQDTGQWMLFDGLNPHSGSQEPPGTGCLPSPGVPNLCTPNVPGQEVSLDDVKTRYR